MGFITNQWLKHSYQDRGHFPIKVEVSSHTDQSSWDKDNNVVATLVFDQQNRTGYTCSKCGVTTIKYGLSIPPPICSNCETQLTHEDKGETHEYSEYQQAYLTQEDVGKIIKDLFLVNSLELNREFIRAIISNISDEFKYELVKLLLNEKVE